MTHIVIVATISVVTTTRIQQNETLQQQRNNSSKAKVSARARRLLYHSDSALKQVHFQPLAPD